MTVDAPPPGRPPRPRRVLVVLGAIAVLVVACLTAYVLAGRAVGTRPITLTDAREVVTIDLPTGWTDTTAAEAGQISTVDDSGDWVPAHRVPDISAYRSSPDGDDPLPVRSWLDVTIDVAAPGVRVRDQHLTQVRRVTEASLPVTWTSPQSIPDIGGHPALRSTGKVRDSGADLFVITVLTDDAYLITFEGTTELPRQPGWEYLPTDPRRDELAQLVAQARIS